MHRAVQTIPIAHIANEKTKAGVAAGKVLLHIVLFKLIARKNDELLGAVLFQHNLSELPSEAPRATSHHYGQVFKLHLLEVLQQQT